MDRNIIVAALSGAGRFGGQMAAARRNERQRQRSGFDEFAAGSISVAHEVSGALLFPSNP